MRDDPASLSLRKGRSQRRRKAIPADRNGGRRANRGPGAGIRETCASRAPDAAFGRRTGQPERRHGASVGRSHRVKSERRIFRRSRKSGIVVAYQCLA